MKEPWASDSDAPEWMQRLAVAFACVCLIVIFTEMIWELTGVTDTMRGYRP